MLRRHRARARGTSNREARAPDTRLPASLLATLGLPSEPAGSSGSGRKTPSPRKRTRKRARMSANDSTLSASSTAAAASNHAKPKLSRRAKRKARARAMEEEKEQQERESERALDTSPVSEGSRPRTRPEISPILLRRRSNKDGDNSSSSEEEAAPHSWRPPTKLGRLGKSRTASVNGKNYAPGQDEPAEPEDDADKREARRLEKLLGIGKKRRSSATKGKRFTYLQLFGEAEKDLADLADLCDDVAAGTSTGAQAECVEPSSSESYPNSGNTRFNRSSLETVHDPDATTEPSSGRSTLRQQDQERSTEEGASSAGDEDEVSLVRDDEEEISNEQDERSTISVPLQSDDDIDVDGDTSVADDEEYESPPRKRVKPGEAKQNTTPAAGTAAYVPPSQRRAASDGDSGRLARRIKGQINLLADANAGNIAPKLELLVRTPGNGATRAEAIQCYTTAALDAVRRGCVTPGLSPFVLAHAAVVRHLGAHLDMRVLASVLVAAVRRIRNTLSLLANDDLVTDEIEPANQPAQAPLGRSPLFAYVALLGALYTQRAITNQVIHDLVRTLADGEEKERVEALRELLEQVGPLLRKDDPASLGDILKFVREKFEPKRSGQVKITLMLDLIDAVKNNKLRKSQVDELELRFAWAARVDTPLSATFEQLSDDKFTQRRWWEGDAVTTRGAAKSTDTVLTDGTSISAGASADIHAGVAGVDLSVLAASLRLNTGYRRALFGAIMSATSVSDAYAKVDAQGGCTGARCDDSVRVVLHCCAAEKGYNPFYALLAIRMCASRQQRFAVEHAVADLLRVVDTGAKKLSKRRQANYAQFIAELLAARALSVAVFRGVDLIDPSPPLKQLAHATFERLARTIRQLQADGKRVFEKVGKAELEPAAMIVHFLKNVVEPQCNDVNAPVVADIIAALGGDPGPQPFFLDDDSD